MRFNPCRNRGIFTGGQRHRGHHRARRRPSQVGSRPPGDSALV